MHNMLKRNVGNIEVKIRVTSPNLASMFFNNIYIYIYIYNKIYIYIILKTNVPCFSASKEHVKHSQMLQYDILRRA